MGNKIFDKTETWEGWVPARLRRGCVVAWPFKLQLNSVITNSRLYKQFKAHFSVPNGELTT
jgi:hypothetical protein